MPKPLGPPERVGWVERSEPHRSSPRQSPPPTRPPILSSAAVGLSLLLWAACRPSLAAATAPELPVARPEQAGMDPGKLARIDQAVAEALQAKRMPGCVVAIGRRGKLAMLRAYGHRQVLPEPVAMTADTVFDLASLTKPIATATSVMILVERGKLRLDDPVARHLGEFAPHGKDRITIADLLTHQGGLIADNSLKDYLDGPSKAWERICQLEPSAAPGTKFIYSDVGFIVLGELVRKVSGRSLAEFAREHVFGPLAMTETGFLPGEGLRRRAAPAEKRDKADTRWICGEVHDPRAYRLGGVAGHAGLFSTANDLALYAQMMLGEGQYAGVRVLRAETVAEMTKARQVPGGLRGLGWDVRTGYSSNRGGSFSPRAFGHGGFTGTSLWIDPGLDLFVIFLSNRLHPDGKGVVNPLAGRIGALAADSLADKQPVPPEAKPDKPPVPPRVLTGIDVLRRDGFRVLAGRKVGLITNHTGIGRDGTTTARLLHQAPGVALAALFSPEHGFQGKLDTSHVPDVRDPETGLAVVSLYGKTRRPTAEMLRGLDTLVFDVQDIGARFYTYVSTMGYAMQVAAEHKLRFVVLDRPNPIGGVEVAGPVLDAGRESFVGFHRLPLRHGMTAGELARMFNDELHLKLDLHVVRIEGWRRSELFDATGLAWINPSPNMRSLTEAILYPGIGLLETTNLSVGRGTATPFEVVGAPWLDGRRLAEKLHRAGLAGVRFEPVEFTPDSSVFANKRCSGVRLALVDRRTFEPVRTGITIACLLRADYPTAWEAKKYDRLLGNAKALEALLAGKSAGDVEAGWQPDLKEFLKRRAKYLLYE